MPVTSDDVTISIKRMGDTDFDAVLMDAYKDVLKSCNSEISVPFKFHELASLRNVQKAHPEAQFFVIVAKEGEKVIGASCLTAYKDLKSAFWIWEGVNQEYRGRGVAAKMHDAICETCTQYFGGQPYYIFLELSKEDPTKLESKLAHLGARELNWNYGPRWSLAVIMPQSRAAKSFISPNLLKELMIRNREIEQARKMTEMEVKQDTKLMSAFADIDQCTEERGVAVKLAPKGAEKLYKGVLTIPF